ncbi:hypothetical protein K470DRAFT_210200 [Piedraia hortae CBS 480.64]|uniref:Mitochondrial zinc maintenance protein 1, mitochondrial n=1 Tax=Piedraia hortae CBS 480.64 TaxID=1314780 RepID=A0A6A7C820_9PEZI|nr:hypothetical protein K470DRAFT_210200 [Piedraia hortae CBS 480.64]
MATLKYAAAKALGLTPVEAANNRFVALSVYRDVLRATRIAFSGMPIPPTLAQQTFAENKGLGSGTEDALKAIQHAEGVAQILRENVVQGKNKGQDTYKLRIHEHTQRLDNDTAKQLKGTSKSFAEIKKSQF